MKHPNEADRSDEGPPRGVRAMAIVRWILIAVMAGVAALSIGYSLGLISPSSAGAATSQYYCPMHPQIVQDHPGECPICSMTLVPKPGAAGAERPATPAPKAAASPSAGAGAHAGHRHDPSDPASSTTPMPAGVPGLVPIELAQDRVQLIGVRTARATRDALVPELRTVGVVAADESRLARVHTRVSGWVEQLAVATTGQKVRRGQTLASIYNVELLPAQQEFLASHRWASKGASAADEGAASAGAGAIASLEDDAKARLELLGMPRSEIRRIAKTGKPSRTLGVSAPIAGYVVGKNVVQGAYVQPGTELFEIADLSKIWVLADVYEHEISRVAVGQKARVEVAAYAGRRFEGKVGFIYPTVDPSTRTLRVRIELDNRDLALRPGMYGDAMLELGEAAGVVVPTEALVDTGDFQYVFIAKDGGRFEPRRVRAGARTGDKVQILEGLAEGETVVTTANFLLDSESRLRAAIEGK